MKMELFEFKNNVWFFVGALLICFAVSVGVRYQQFETWKKTPKAYFVGERPMMTTLDAPYWLRWAREYNEGVYKQKNGLRGYPNNTLQYLKQREEIVSKKFRDTSDESTARSSSVIPSYPAYSSSAFSPFAFGWLVASKGKPRN